MKSSVDSILAECEVLGSILLKNDVMNDVALILKPDDFYYECHKQTFKKMIHLYERDKPIDPVTLEQPDLLEMMNSVPTPENAQYYANIVKKNALKRRVAEIGEKIVRISQESVDDIETFYQEIEKVTDGIRGDVGTGLYDTKEINKSYLDYMTRKDEFLTTGFSYFDEWTGGVGRGWLYVLGGRPATGKTAKMLQMALHMAVHGQVLIFSQETKKEALYNRILSNLSKIPYARIRRKELTDSEKEEIQFQLTVLEELQLKIGDAGSYSVEQIRAYARRVKKKHRKINAIFIDYLGIMDIPHDRNKTYAQAVGSVSTKLKTLALDLDCTIILLCQLNRESEKADKPSLTHLRDSGNIEQDADIVEILWKKDPQSDIVDAEIVKGRDVGLKSFEYRFNANYQTFKEVYHI